MCLNDKILKGLHVFLSSSVEMRLICVGVEVSDLAGEASRKWLKRWWKDDENHWKHDENSWKHDKKR